MFNPELYMIPNREDALKLLHQYIENDRMIAHSLSSEAVMRAMALHLDRNVEK